MNPYGGFPNPMMAAGFIGNTGGGRSNMRGGGQGNYMNRSGRGGGMMGYGDGSGFNGNVASIMHDVNLRSTDLFYCYFDSSAAGYPGMHINPAFFDQQGYGQGG